MNRLTLATLALALGAAPLFAADAPAAPAAKAKPAKAPKAAKAAPVEALKTDDERTLYAYGFRIGQNIGNFGFNDAEVRAITAGLRDAAANKGAAVDMSLFLPKVGEMLEKRVAAKASAEKEKGKAYARAFAQEAGVKALPESAGWSKSLKDGDGAQPKPEDTVKVNYRGTLIDGTEFDSSYSRHEPATFPLNHVIPCWTQGVAQMKVGGKAKLVCPSDAAYGDQGHPPTIPGGATLVFEVELLDVTRAEAPKAEAPKK